MEALFAIFGLFLVAVMLLIGFAFLVAALQGLILAFRTSLLFGALCMLLPFIPFVVFGLVFWFTGIDLPERILSAFREPAPSPANSQNDPKVPAPASVPASPGTDRVTAPPSVPANAPTPVPAGSDNRPADASEHVPAVPSEPISKLVAHHPAVVTEGDVVEDAPKPGALALPIVAYVDPAVKPTADASDDLPVQSNCNGTGGVEEDEAEPAVELPAASPATVAVVAQPPTKALVEPANPGH